MVRLCWEEDTGPRVRTFQEAEHREIAICARCHSDQLLLDRAWACHDGEAEEAAAHLYPNRLRAHVREVALVYHTDPCSCGDLRKALREDDDTVENHEGHGHGGGLELELVTFLRCLLVGLPWEQTEFAMVLSFRDHRCLEWKEEQARARDQEIFVPDQEVHVRQEHLLEDLAEDHRV